MNSKEIFDQLSQQLSSKFDNNEAKQMAFILLEDLFDVARTKILAHADIEADTSVLQNYVDRLLNDEPLQYLLGKADFYGRPFIVKPDVLIPRPETEELVYRIVERHKMAPNLNLVDIGTGSGCIPITAALELPKSTVWGIDISEKALTVAAENAKLLQANVTFVHKDILNETLEELPKMDVIVSNPPYVTDSERALMKPNVLAHEPELALFVPDHDPLRFYRRIATLATNQLKDGGWLYFEINEQFGHETKRMMEELGFKQVAIMQDMQGKDRMAEGYWSA
ncbi:peptide chain release factor N(5)-glutamine methyltransferase [Limibacter armeniacum]|uniref:peptide chain release factor N(5)-glutamine methyltransferase n=1 Tax=Limibacter armeniacum TaxID=466084 RepID=UPI002FE61FA8